MRVRSRVGISLRRHVQQPHSDRGVSTLKIPSAPEELIVGWWMARATCNTRPRCGRQMTSGVHGVTIWATRAPAPRMQDAIHFPFAGGQPIPGRQSGRGCCTCRRPSGSGCQHERRQASQHDSIKVATAGGLNAGTNVWDLMIADSQGIFEANNLKPDFFDAGGGRSPSRQSLAGPRRSRLPQSMLPSEA